jgi:hypothetical protein
MQSNNRFQRNGFIDATGATRVLGSGEAVTGATLIGHEDRYLSNTIGAHGAANGDGVALAIDGCSTVFPGSKNTLTNDVFANNASTGAARGTVFASCAAGALDLQFVNNTLVANTGDGTVGLWGDPDETLTVANSIIWGNHGGAELTGFASAPTTFSDFCDSTAPVVGIGNICADPLLTDVANSDVHETAGSPTIDVGSNGAVPAGFVIDYEGHNRFIDSDKNGSAVVDIGADERQPPAPPVVVPLPIVPGPIEPIQQSATPAVPVATPEQLVAGVKQAGSTPAKKPTKKKKCGDNTGPTSRFLNRLSKAARFSGERILTIRGQAAYKKCKAGDKGKIKRVNFTIHLIQGGKCRWLTKARTLGPPTSCKRKRVYFKAKGTTKWSFVLKGPMPPGKYLADVQAVDNVGNKERPSRHRNFRHFRIDGFTLRQGWTGKHPDDYTKRG